METNDLGNGSTKIDKLVVTKWFNLSPAKDDERSKSFKLELTIPKGTSVDEMARGILASEVIKCQNSNRPKWDKLVDKSTFRRTFMKPATVDVEAEFHNRFENLSPTEQMAELEKLSKMIKGQ